jgi:tetratricopeptide (TPR) repeat protein
MLPLAKRKPDFAEGYGATFFDEGLCYHQQNKFDNAKECFARALHIYEGEEKWPAPKNAELGIADCHLYIGMCLEAQGDRKEAREHIEESLRISTILEVRDNIQRANGLLKKMESQSQRR